MSRSIVLEAIWKVPLLRARRPARAALMRAVTDATLRRARCSRPRGRSSSTSGRRGASRARPSTAILEQLGEEHAGRIDVVGVDVDANPGVASRYGVLTLPTAILFEGGEARAEVLGARSRAHYERAVAAGSSASTGDGPSPSAAGPGALAAGDRVAQQVRRRPPGPSRGS